MVSFALFQQKNFLKVIKNNYAYTLDVPRVSFRHHLYHLVEL